MRAAIEQRAGDGRRARQATSGLRCKEKRS
jgi:hypothetical protein